VMSMKNTIFWDTLSYSLIETRLRVFKNMMLMRIFGPKRDEIIEG
jgi:hypothetical protein